MRKLLYILLLFSVGAQAQNTEAQNKTLIDVIRNSGLTPARVANALEGINYSKVSIKGVYTTTGTNTYAVTAGTGIINLDNDIQILVKFANANSSSTVSLNVNALGALPLKTNLGADPDIGGIAAGSIYLLATTGSVWRIVGPTNEGGTAITNWGDIPTGNLDDQTDLYDTLNTRARRWYKVKTVSSNYTAALGDENNKLIVVNGGGNFEIPKDADVDFPDGSALLTADSLETATYSKDAVVTLDTVDTHVWIKVGNDRWITPRASSGGSGSGSVTSIGTTSPITGGPITTTGTIGINNSVADGSTKGAASFAAADFNASSGNISIDYTNGQTSSGSNPGFLSSTDWTTFNNKVPSTRTISTTSPLSGGGDLSANRTLSISDAVADGSTKGAAAFNATYFDASSGVVNIDLTNGAASASQGGYVTTGTQTFAGAKTFTNNANASFNIGGTWSASANNQYHAAIGGSFTARNISSDFLYGYIINPALSHNSTNQTLTAVYINPTLSSGANTIRKVLNVADAFNFFKEGKLVITASVDETATFGGSGQFAALELGGSVNSATAKGINNLSGLTANINGSVLTGYRNASVYTASIYTSLTAIGFDWNPSFSGTFATQYGILIRPSASLSGFGTATPTSTLHTAGSFSTGYVAKTGAYSLTSTDFTVEVTSGTHTQTLPTAVGITGRIYIVTNTGSGTVTLGTTSSQTFVNVSGTPTTLTLNQFDTARVQSNGANWLRL